MSVQARVSPQINGTHAPSFSYDLDVVEGDLLLNCLSTTGLTTPTGVPTDSIGTIYTLLGSVTAGNGISLWAYMGIAPVSGPNTVKHRLSTIAPVTIMLVDAPSWQAAVGVGPVNGSSGTATTNPTIGPLTTVNPQSLVISFLRTSLATITGGEAGWTLVSADGSGLEFIVPSAVATYNASYVTTGGLYSGLIVSLLPTTTLLSVSTIPASAITPTSIQFNGDINRVGPGGNATIVGFKYGPNQLMTETVQLTGSFGPGPFNIVVTGLDPGQDYHFQAFATSPDGTFYGQVFAARTISQVPVVWTSYAVLTDYQTVQFIGSIRELGATNSNATEVGFNYGPTSDYGSKVSLNGSFGIGPIIATVTGLPPGQTYHFQAYAISPDGIGVGRDLIFSTFTIPDSQVIHRQTAPAVSFNGNQAVITFLQPCMAGSGIQLDIFWKGAPGILPGGVSDNQLIGTKPANSWALQRVHDNGYANPNQLAIWTTNDVKSANTPLVITVNFSDVVTEGYALAREFTGQFKGLDWFCNTFKTISPHARTDTPVIPVKPTLPGELLVVDVFTNATHVLTRKSNWGGFSSVDGQGSFIFSNPALVNFFASPCVADNEASWQMLATSWVPVAAVPTDFASSKSYLVKPSGKRLLRGPVELMSAVLPDQDDEPTWFLPGWDWVESRPGWTYPGLRGLVYRTQWAVVEPEQGVYDMSGLDHVLNVLCPKYDRPIGLLVGAGTGAYPSWLTGVEMLTFEAGTFPAPWDPVFQEAWNSIIQHIGNRYDKNPYLAYVFVTGFAPSNQVNFCTHEGDNEVFFNADAFGGDQDAAVAGWFQAVTNITGFFYTAFPHCALGWTNGPIVYHFDWDPFWRAQNQNFRSMNLAVRDNALNFLRRYNGQIGNLMSLYSRWGAEEVVFQELRANATAGPTIIPPGGVPDVATLTALVGELKYARTMLAKAIELYPHQLNLTWCRLIEQYSAEMNNPDWCQVNSHTPWFN